MIDIENAWDNFLEDGEIESELLENNESDNYTPKVSDIYIYKIKIYI